MPTSTLEYTRSAQEQTLSSLQKSQDTIVDLVGSWAKAVESTVAELPALPVPAALPSAEELVKSSFDFGQEILSSQRQFAERLVSASAPAVKVTPVEAPSA